MSRKGGPAEQCGAKRCRSPNQGPPDRPMGRVSAAGPPPDLLPAVWTDAEGRSGCPGRGGSSHSGFFWKSTTYFCKTQDFSANSKKYGKGPFRPDTSCHHSRQQASCAPPRTLKKMYVRSRYMYAYACICMYLYVYCCFQYRCIASTA